MMSHCHCTTPDPLPSPPPLAPAPLPRCPPPQVLHQRELRTAPERIERMLERVSAQHLRERGLQERYKLLMSERDDVARMLAAHAPARA